MRTNYRELARLKRKEVSNRQIAVIMNLSCKCQSLFSQVR